MNINYIKSILHLNDLAHIAKMNILTIESVNGANLFEIYEGIEFIKPIKKSRYTHCQCDIITNHIFLSLLDANYLIMKILKKGIMKNNLLSLKIHWNFTPDIFEAFEEDRTLNSILNDKEKLKRQINKTKKIIDTCCKVLDEECEKIKMDKLMDGKKEIEE